MITGVEETFAACTDGDSEATSSARWGVEMVGRTDSLLSAASAFVAGWL
ncbi:hypothetical protein ABLN97_13990 [Mycobacterium tuberculosis]